MKKTILALIMLLGAVCQMHATTIVPPSDLGKMSDMSEVVIVGTNLGHINGDTYLNNFEILEVLKGDFTVGDYIEVREYSGRYGTDGPIYKIDGDVDYGVGKTYLIYLNVNSLGEYKASLLSVSVFEQGIVEGKIVFGHNESINGLKFAGHVNSNIYGVYEKEALLTHLKDYINNQKTWNSEEAGMMNIDYGQHGHHHHHDHSDKTQGGNDYKAPCPNDPPAHCTTIFGDAQAGDQTSCAADTPGKFETNNWNVCLASGASTDPSNAAAVTDLQNAITTMNGMPGVNISYTGVGTCVPMCLTGSAANDALDCSGGFPPTDPNKMWVFLDDPCNEITDLNATCEGVLGIGGSFSLTSCHQDLCGDFWKTNITPFFVMNNGSGCAGNYSYTATLVHEMLHALGIGHIGGDAGDPGTGSTQCTALMNPVVCNANAVDPVAPDFGLTSLDNACADWMYNPSAATACAITNVTLNTAATCSGDNATFEVCFDVTDGSGAYDIEVGGIVTSDAAAGATTGNVCVTTTVTGPTAMGNVTVNVRDDADFSCVDDTNLSVALPECPPPCASTCADAAANSCGVYITADDTFATSIVEIANGGGENCLANPVDFVAGDPNQSFTQCFEYVATTTSFGVLSGTSVFEINDPTGDPNDDPNSCFQQITALEVYDPNGAGCATPTDITATNIFSGAMVGTTYVVCVTAESGFGTADGDGCQFACIANSVTPLNPVCDAGTATGPSVTDVCAGVDPVVSFADCSGLNLSFLAGGGPGNGCAEPDLLFAGEMYAYTMDPVANGLNVGDAIGFTANIAGDCTITLPTASFPNTTCDPIIYTVYLQPREDVYCFDSGIGALGDYLGTTAYQTDCGLLQATFTVYPDPANFGFSAAVDGSCPSTDPVAPANTGTCLYDIALVGGTGVNPAPTCPTAPADGTAEWSISYPTALAAMEALCASPANETAVEAGCIPAAGCAMCMITPDPAINIVCDNNGTAGDPSDDTYTFDILVNGSNPTVGASNTFNDDQGNAGVAYGTTLSYGPFPISGGNITVNFTDADDGTCMGSMMAAAPATCSDATTTIDIIDPCSCAEPIVTCGAGLGNIDLDMDGNITETDLVVDVIQITVTPATVGEMFTVTAAGDALNCDETAITSGTVLTDMGGGIYTLEVYYYADGTGFGTMSFAGDMGSPTVSITNPSVEYPACTCSLVCNCDADGGRF